MTAHAHDGSRLAYEGPERRHHRVYVTRNTEYHLRAGTCVAVRDRRTAAWLEGHLAIGRRLSGGVRVAPSGEALPVPRAPGVGEALYFAQGDRELITSVLCGVERPDRATVAAYEHD
jgi:hypothetical protein